MMGVSPIVWWRMKTCSICVYERRLIGKTGGVMTPVTVR